MLVTSANAQTLTEKDGKYYTSDSKLYTGHYVSVFDNGNVQMEMQLVKGMKDGEVLIYAKDGQLKELCSYKKNVKDGLWESYNEKGVKVAIANYKKGKKDGEWRIWDDSGKLIYEMFYVNGEKFGTWKRFSTETGELVAERSYK